MKQTSLKFNWVDAVILLLIVSAALIILNRDALFGDTVVSSDGVGGKQTLLVTTKALSVPKTTVDAFKVGDILVANGKEQVGKITGVESRPSLVFELIDGQVKQIVEPDYFDVYVSCEIQANRYASYMEFGGQEVKVGLNFYVKTAKAEAFGYLVKLEKVK